MRSPSLSLFLFTFFLIGCNTTKSANPDSPDIGNERLVENAYAEKFSIEKIGNHYLLKVFSPWQNASDASFEYLVGNSEAGIPDSVSETIFIQSPVKNVVIMSTTFIAFIDTLGEIPTISGVSGGEYTYNNELRSRIDAKLVRDIGFDQNLNYEVIVDLNPDVVFMFGVQSGVVQTISKLKEFRIPVVLCADYLEPTPLGRAEWINFFSIFYDKLEIAKSIFSEVESNYNLLAHAGSKNSNKPKVMLGLPWKDTWYVAGGFSYAAQLINDAGGDYIFKDLENAEAIPMDIEAVFARCLDADIWINPGVATTLEMVLAHDQRFELLNSFQNKNIYSNAKRVGPTGGNDYWESGIIHPDQILEDLMKIFKDSARSRDELHYYLKLN